MRPRKKQKSGDTDLSCNGREPQRVLSPPSPSMFPPQYRWESTKALGVEVVKVVWCHTVDGVCACVPGTPHRL